MIINVTKEFQCYLRYTVFPLKELKPLVLRGLNSYQVEKVSMLNYLYLILVEYRITYLHLPYSE